MLILQVGFAGTQVMYPTPRNAIVAVLLVTVIAVYRRDCRAGETASILESVDFVRQIQPLLRKHCYQCHGRDVQEGGLRLDLRQHALHGGDSGKVILPGQANDSRLMQLISGKEADGQVMPPEDEGRRLNDDELALIRRWIGSGANWPDGVDPVETIRNDPWSFKTVTRPLVPAVRNSAWVRNPVDAFVLAGLENANIDPAPDADANSIARRVAFDLTGLPLSLEQFSSFKSQHAVNSEAAYMALLDTLLASPHYGERWGRHWLDVVRYADSNGYEMDREKPLAWQYRDYVIRSLNEDKPFNRFVLEQIAGDELDNASPQTVIATGFLRVGPWDAERGASVQPAEVVAERFNELDDLVSTTSQAFLGLTLGCARCHDHKFDPLSSLDYYSMVAIFNPLARHKKGRDELTRPAVPPRELKDKNAADEQIDVLIQRIRELESPLLQGIVEAGKTTLPEDVTTALKVSEDKRTDAHQQLLKRYASVIDREIQAAFKDSELTRTWLSSGAIQEIGAARAEIADLQARFDYPPGYFFHEPSPTPPVTHLLKRGNPNQPGAVVPPAVPRIVDRQMKANDLQFEPPDGITSRRRIALARWIAHRDNPLTPRVIVNRVWQFHFGAGIVRSPNDFGNRGTEPSHPELLDWLAHWFVNDASWSLKKLHLLIMSSSTYRMSKNPSPDVTAAAVDPDNRLLSYFPRRRLEVEAIRDAILAVSGQLNQQVGGACMYPKIPAAALRSGYDPEKVWKPFDEPDASRRTVYAYLKRSLVIPFLETLDFCDTTQSSARRNVTTVAPQALELLNGEFVTRQSSHFAARLQREAGSDLNRQVEHAWQLALGRAPRQNETTEMVDFVEQETISQTAGGASQDGAADHLARTQALAAMCRVIFNLNEFVYTD